MIIIAKIHSKQPIFDHYNIIKNFIRNNYPKEQKNIYSSCTSKIGRNAYDEK